MFREKSTPTTVRRAASAPDLSQMFPEMLPCQLGVGRIAPFNLIESGHRIAQVWNIEVPICVMMREMPMRLSSGCSFNCREGRIWKLPHVLPAPFRGVR